jgi:hypothetical protein
MQNQIHIDKDYAWFTGSLDNNFQHKHYAIQLTIPLDDALLSKHQKRLCHPNYQCLFNLMWFIK